jgi:hypothetical protein
MEKKITVLLVDDHSLVRRGFRRMLEDESDLHVVGELDRVALDSQLDSACVASPERGNSRALITCLKVFLVFIHFVSSF